jgi:NADH dehydrogenase
LGGTGFVGRHLVARLANNGYHVKVLTRYLQKHRDISILPGIEIAEVDIRTPGMLLENFSGYDAIINLVGILYEHSGQQFRSIHVDLPRDILEACHTVGVKRLLHMSALCASANRGPSQYLFSKGEGEQLVMQARNLGVTCFKPSIIFAPDDKFYNRFADMLKTLPIFPIVCPDTKFAPVYVGNVVNAFEIALKREATIGKSYELCGPHIYTLREIIEDIIRMLDLKRTTVSLPDKLSLLQAKILGKFNKIFTTDNYLSLQIDSICECNGLKELGITPCSVNGIMSMYFAGKKNQRRRYDQLRMVAHRD